MADSTIRESVTQQCVRHMPMYHSLLLYCTGCPDLEFGTPGEFAQHVADAILADFLLTGALHRNLELS